MTENKLNSILKTLALLLIATLTINTASAQLHVAKKGGEVTEDGNVGIGTDKPTVKLQVNGRILATGGKISIDASKNADGTLESAALSVGAGRTLDGASAINLFADPNATGFDAITGRFISKKEGQKYITAFTHNGSGNFSLRTWQPNSNIIFNTAGKTNALFIGSNGNVGIGTDAPTANLEVNGVAKKPNGGMWAGASDKRTKKNISQYTKGLMEVLKLNPVTYNYNGKAGITDTERAYVGLIAQEFAEIEPNAVESFSYTEEGSNKTEEYLSLDATSVQYMLVNAIKEQQAKIESLEEKLEKVAANGTVTNLTENEISVLLEGTGTEKALLAQNTPNPFTTNTRIEYFIPADSRHCRMSFRDMNGKEIKQVEIKHDGIGAVELSAKDLAAGIYSYVLYVNGDIIASKKMILKQ